ncbi:Feruloyl esterase [Penicillium ucsense]|uniref:Feruloyl esterase C n=1 Tax=Penicillium ucsense TaxID=2839758 RepID=A0A8J8WJC6_9EURO|nr:Feruloyl esterase [Penicillium ucsense]KAF7733773.1 Feruloyl esterase [Penicillium ucsense]
MKTALVLAFAASALGQQTVWGQCGGNGWSGATTCTSGNCCSSINPWYSQCIPGDCAGGGGGQATTTSTSVTTTATSGTGPTSNPNPGSGNTSKGCGTSTTLKSGTYSITVNGKQRQYILALPDNYDRSKSYKLIFGLHWLGGSMQDVAGGNYYGVRPLSGNNVIFVAPQGLNNGWANAGGEDITLMDQIREKLQAELCIDNSQIYSMGWSYGGSMSYALACARPDVFRGVAVMSGANLSGCSPGTQPVAYYAQHGVSDTVLPIDRGRSIRDTFVKDNKCTAQNAPEPAAGSGTHIKTVYEGCSSGHPVWWIPFDGPHEPLATDRGASSSWTPGEIWKFISQFS